MQQIADWLQKLGMSEYAQRGNPLTNCVAAIDTPRASASATFIIQCSKAAGRLRSPPPHSGYFYSTPSTLKLRA